MLNRKNVGVFIGPIGAQFSLFFSGILISRALGVNARGELAFIMILISIAAIAGGLSASQLAAIYALSNPPAKVLLGVLSQLKVPMLLMSFSASIYSCIYLKNFLIVLPVFLAILSQIVIGIEIGILRGKQKFIQSSLLQLSQPFLFSILLFIGFFYGFSTLVEILFIWSASMIFSMALSIYLLFNLSFQMHAVNDSSQGAFPHVRKRGYIGLLSTYSPLESFKIDQLGVFFLLSSKDLGLFVTALAFANAPKLVGQTLSGLVPGWFHHSANGSRRFIGKSALACIVISISAGLFAKTFIPSIFGNQFSEATNLALPLALAGGFMGVRTLLVEVLRYHEREGVSTTIELFSFTFFIIAVFRSKNNLDITLYAYILLAASLISAFIMYLFISIKRFYPGK